MRPVPLQGPGVASTHCGEFRSSACGGILILMSTTLLDRLIEPFAECLTPESAQKIAALRADDEMQQHLDELAERANQGTLSDADRSEYERILAAFHFVTVMQARARRFLRAS